MCVLGGNGFVLQLLFYVSRLLNIVLLSKLCDSCSSKQHLFELHAKEVDVTAQVSFHSVFPIHLAF